MGITPSEEQIFACADAQRWFRSRSKPTFEISGPAGSGKTWLVKMIIERLKLTFDDVLFIAYMGKAVSQLSKHGLPAKTLHSAIYNYIRVADTDDDGIIIRKANGAPKMIGMFELRERIKKVKLIILDEGSTVEKKLGTDLLSFGIPIIVLGDLNQLQPPFGTSIFLERPDVILTSIHRQSEDSEIIWLSQQVLQNKPLKIGVYGNSAVIRKEDLTDFHFRTTDIVLTGTNKLRSKINNYYREEIRGYKNLELPHLHEKVICRRNNWDRMVDKGIYLTNGTSGIITHVDRSSFNGKSLKIDFKADFSRKELRNLSIDYNRLATQNMDINGNKIDTPYNPSYDIFEYAYAITTHSSQGSQYPRVIFLLEKFLSGDDYKRLVYTGITRAEKSIIIAI